ncbi:MAG: DUF3301 domain-containing protein [Gammaproteobacteria bacterium]|nr:DUF3301 domain-containing protein [Gammaproteobacteria bacterium]MCW8988091.1 DUF3301 domain-containing protein [Gammaproteobacteria bacterium]MCW9031662.1 DUF3301 domain-containing protein [Gammaproteobacteria bacterium]
MMSGSDFTVFVFLLSTFLYWLDSIRAKEIATTYSREACKKVSLEFLDETVSISKVRLRRNSSGRLVFYREYQFEFTSTGEYRYKGKVKLLGKMLIGVEMEPHQFIEEKSELL